MAEVQPPFVLQAGTASHPAMLFRRMLQGVVQVEGVDSFNGSDDLKIITNAPEDMSVRVSHGGAYIKGDTTSDQGFYFVYNDGNELVTLAAADATNPRKDIIIAKVEDATEDAGSDAWVLDKVTGTPGGSPSEPALPDSAIKLAVIDVPANDTSIQAGQITDSRKKWNRFIGCAVRRSTAFALAVGDNAIPWNAEEYDSDDFHSTSTNPSRFTVPAGLEGTYAFQASLFSSVDDKIRKNGSLLYTFKSAENHPPVIIPDLVAGDYIEFVASGGGEGAEQYPINSRALFWRVGL